MSVGATAGATTGASVAAAAAIANAIKASGAIVRVEPEAFLEVLTRAETPLVITNEQKIFFKVQHQYLTSYRGFVFHVKTPTPITIPEWCEIIKAKTIWIPL